MARAADKQETRATTPSGVLSRAVPVAALAACLLLGILLAVRPISSVDLGYHLAYGDRFLDHGEIVDTNPFIYTIGSPGDHGPDDRGPGCWFDDRGRYRFPNANWLMQVIMSAAHRAGGAAGLCALQAGLVAGTFALVLVTMRRLHVPWGLAAAGVLVMAMGGYPRFTLRPELVSYLLLAAQMAILVGPASRWRSVAALVGLQLLFVNLHSFYVLGLALTGAFVAEGLLRLGWHRLAERPAEEAYRAVRRRTVLLSAALGGQVAVCFANPWTWRIVALPVQTLLFLREHKVGQPGATTHPWAQIGELYGTLAAGFASVRASITHGVLLALTAVAAVGTVVRRKWAWLFIMAGLTAVSLSVRRNIAVAPLLATPLVLAALWSAFGHLAARLRPRLRGRLAAAGCGALLLAAAWWCASVVTQRFYYAERLPYRFGVGYARAVMPRGAAAWLTKHRPDGQLWTGLYSSSNIHYFTAVDDSGRRPDVPVVTNTWAQPPSVIGEVVRTYEGRRDFSIVEREYAPQVVVLHTSSGCFPLLRRLVADEAWTVTYLGAAHVVFLRSDGPNERLARRYAITADSLDLSAYKRRLADLDPVGAYSTYLGGLALHYLGWQTAAIDVIRASLELDDGYAAAWGALGAGYAERGRQRHLTGDRIGGKRDLRKAIEYFDKALRLDASLKEVQRDLDRARQELKALP